MNRPSFLDESFEDGFVCTSSTGVVEGGFVLDSEKGIGGDGRGEEEGDSLFDLGRRGGGRGGFFFFSF